MIGEVSKAGFFSGTKVTTKAYTPFGEQIGEKTSGFGWNGEYYNAVTGQVYLRARFYEPEMNRFSQKDRVSGSIVRGTSLNRYLYCYNDPMNYKDSNGLYPVANQHDGEEPPMPLRTGRTPPKPQPPATPAVDPRSAGSFTDNIKARARQRNKDIAANGPAPARDPMPGVPRVEYPAEGTGDGACEPNSDDSFLPFLLDDLTSVTVEVLGNILEDLGKTWAYAKHLSVSDVMLGESLVKLSNSLTIIGTAIDLGTMIAQGDDVGTALIKVAVHTLIGIGVAAFVAGGSLPTLIVGGVATLFLTSMFDEIYDSIEESFST